MSKILHTKSNRESGRVSVWIHVPDSQYVAVPDPESPYYEYCQQTYGLEALVGVYGSDSVYIELKEDIIITLESLAKQGIIGIGSAFTAIKALIFGGRR